MRPFDILVVTFKNLFRQKSRSFLAIAQMMVGVFLISMMLSIGNGLKEFMISQVTLFSNKRTMSTFKGSQGVLEKGIQSLGLGQKVEEFEGDKEEGMDSDVVFSLEDLEEVREIPHVSQAVFQSILIADYVRLESFRSKKLKISVDCMPLLLKQELRFAAVDEEQLSNPNGIVLPEGYAEVWDRPFEELLGEYVWVRFSQTDGQLQGLFDERMAYSTKTQTKEFKLRIVGFVEKNIFSQMGFISPAMGDEISAFIVDKSITDFQKESRFTQIRIIVDEEKNVESVDNKLQEFGYNTMTYDDSVGQIGVVFNIISGALTIFGLISVGVSSIGVANTLLMAVSERKREIGVMKAVGASSRVIQRLFIVEALWLGTLGGGLGLGISYLISHIANSFLHNGIIIEEKEIIGSLLNEYPALNIAVYPIWMICAVMVLTVMVTIFAGLSPANKASKLDPIIVLKQ